MTPSVAPDFSDPLVSVVIPSVSGMPIVAECVRCLLGQEGGRVEVVVVDRTGEATRAALRELFPQVEVIAAADGTSIPALRAVALTRVRGEIVAVTEDHCLAQPGWLVAILRAFRQGHRVVGGPVDNGSPERVVDWAVFFCEYARFMGPVARGVGGEVAGNNCAYDRRLFDHLQQELQAEAWESAWHARLRGLGVEFYTDPDMAVLHKKAFGYWYFVGQRYHYSRSFAGLRLAGTPYWKRGAYACATLLLPGLLLWRTAAAVARKRRHGWQFVRCLPVLLTFLLVWAYGETVGALFGPGNSLRRVD